MLYSLDRFEANTAILVDEEGNNHVVPFLKLPEEAAAGTMIRYEDGVYSVDMYATAERRRRIAAMQEKLINSTKKKKR